jgi:hypothetical protein
MMTGKPKLVFVYNADSGLFNTLADMAHKIVSPETYNCQLCKLTYGNIGMREQWKAYLDTIDAELVFLHRDEFFKQYRENAMALPAMFLDRDGVVDLFMSEAEINACQSLDALIEKLDTKLAGLTKQSG